MNKMTQRAPHCKMPMLDNMHDNISIQKSRSSSGAERKKDFYTNPIWIVDTSREWESVLHEGTYLTFKAKELIPPVHNGEKGFYYLKYGKVRVVHKLEQDETQDKEVTLYHLGEGTLMHDTTFHDYDTPYAIHAITPVEAYFFAESRILNVHFAEEYPHLLLGLVRAQALKNLYFMRRIINIAGGNAFANTCKLMLELSRSYGNALEVPLGVTHEEIASLLCVRRSWLGKILRKLKDDGVISRCTKSRLVITDLNKLAEYATMGAAQFNNNVDKNTT